MHVELINYTNSKFEHKNIDLTEHFNNNNSNNNSKYNNTDNNKNGNSNIFEPTDDGQW